MSNSSRRIHDLQQVYVRQSVILRNNLGQFDQRLHIGEDWPSMLGRLNAAMNQTTNVDQGIDDSLDHFAIEPKKCLANPVDVPFFLSVRIVDDVIDSDVKVEGGVDGSGQGGLKNENQKQKNPVEHVIQYEKDAARFAREFEENMIRF